VVPGAVGGFVESATLHRDRISVAGWAATFRHGAADRVVVFVNGRFVGTVQPSQERLDVAGGYGEAALRSGFKLSRRLVPALRDPGSARIEVLAVRGGRASRLSALGE
jgi:hypothetical protein